ncbi:hypothetical protein OR1_01562 [Geobacter sp. OR-1]|uniref:hypothetical protein n=1 Tax=Geobacter sp. OR-1 TaxID=1266765 RepID=UPI000542CE46|nr:hypothetical protein [Geobacter sp. OR-1]GAM09287.1 hypothetical protein OR1_01562 [Geobacter sp. OR-1]
MKKIPALLTLLFATAVICFATFSLFKGNLEAAFSSFPFLLIIYMYVKMSAK